MVTYRSLFRYFDLWHCGIFKKGRRARELYLHCFVLCENSFVFLISMQINGEYCYYINILRSTNSLFSF